MDGKTLDESRLANKPIAHYGINYIDRALTGILPQDLILIGADSGVGKSELAYHMAWHNAKNMKVHLFALESDNDEPIHRFVYKKIANKYFSKTNRDYVPMTYRDYITGNFSITPWIDEVMEEVNPLLENLTIHYRDDCSDIESFQIAIHQINDGGLIILDHIDYLDLDSNSTEISQMTSVMKILRELNKAFKIPLVIISHMRKKVNKNQIIPDQEDFYGSSNKAKVAKTVIIISPDYSNLNYKEMLYGTFIRIAKSRIGFPRNLLGRVVFDAKTNSYDKDFVLARVNYFNTKIQDLERSDYPDWAIMGCESFVDKAHSYRDWR